ncbi:N-formylglutamate amidohydrolase [Sphingobium aromaticiconvertens]|uniref:N-formylglutamate amidohydrolase n=1 Tax=Sphingobium aromaticiconvertens TaxID=365341 RepID=UPI00301A387D
MEQPAPRDGPRTAPIEQCLAYDRYGPDVPSTPIILSVPHAGRHYPPGLSALARVRPSVLRRLEDRYADLLVDPLIAAGWSVLVARAPRAMMDLNRHECEIDPAMVSDLPRTHALQSSVKLRGGLGLVPRRLQGVGDLWLRPLPFVELERRIATIHRPYHAALTRLMHAAHAAHGHAILIDLHSMPSLPFAPDGEAGPMLVLGDRFGRSAAPRLGTLVGDIATARGFASAQNHPYAGDHLIERHGRPGAGFHALQIEIDRALYLDAALDEPGSGLPRVQALITVLAEALAQELPRANYAMAAE